MSLYEEGFTDGFVIGKNQAKAVNVFRITQMPEFSAVPSSNYVYLYWLYPADNSVASVIICKKQGNYAQTINDGEIIYNGNGLNYNDIEVALNTTYYYRLFCYDSDNNLIDSQDTCKCTTTAVTRYKVLNAKTYDSYWRAYYYSYFQANTKSTYENNTWVLKFSVEEVFNDDGYRFLMGTSGYFAIRLKGQHVYIDNYNSDLSKRFIDTGITVNIGDYVFGLTLTTSGGLFYINGIQVFSFSCVVNMKQYIGIGSSSSLGDGFLIKIKEVQLWNKILSPQEMLFYSQYNPVGLENNLLQYYPFSEGTGMAIHSVGMAGGNTDGLYPNTASLFPVRYSIEVPSYKYILVYLSQGRYYSVTSSCVLYYNTSIGIVSTAVANAYNEYYYNASNNTWVLQQSGGSAGAFNIMGFSGCTMIYSNYDIMDQLNALYFKGNIDTNTWQLA